MAGTKRKRCGLVQLQIGSKQSEPSYSKTLRDQSERNSNCPKLNYTGVSEYSDRLKTRTKRIIPRRYDMNGTGDLKIQTSSSDSETLIAVNLMPSLPAAPPASVCSARLS
jgi:hypothetical protein